MYWQIRGYSNSSLDARKAYSSLLDQVQGVFL